MLVIASEYHCRRTLEALRLKINTQNESIHSRIEASWFKLGGITDPYVCACYAISWLCDKPLAKL